LLTPSLPSSLRLSLSFLSCSHFLLLLSLFSFTDTATTEIYTLSLHDALPISYHQAWERGVKTVGATAHFVNSELDEGPIIEFARSEEHTSELQSRFDLVCRLLLEKKKNKNKHHCQAYEQRRK